MDMVMFDLQTAALAAAGSGIPVVPDTGGNNGGMSFSEVLAAQAENTSAAAEIQADTAENTVPEEGYVVPEEYLPKNATAAFADIFSQLMQADYGVQKGMKMLLETMIRAVMGSNDGQQRKTDLFSMFYDGSSSFLGGDEDMFLLCGGIMNSIADTIAWEQENGAEDDEIIEALKEALKRMYGTEDVEDDEEDEDEIPVDILAALIHSPMTEEEMDEYVVMDKAAIVETVKDAFSYPKQMLADEAPEKAQRMEELFADYKAAVSDEALAKHSSGSEDQYLSEPIRMSFSGVKINNAAEQIRTITGTDDAAAAAAQMPQFIQAAGDLREIPQEEGYDVPVPVDEQVGEFITDRLSEITDENGTEELVMILKPEHLGQVAIKLVKENGAVSVTISAQHAEVGRMMAERAAELSSSLESKDIEVKNVEVVNPGNAAAQMGLDFTNQGFSRRQEYSSEGNRNSYGRIEGIEGIAETDEIEETENIMIREAKLWTQA